MELEVSIDETHAGCKIIRATGEIDHHTFSVFEEAMEHCLNAKPALIVVNFGGVSYVSSSGIGILMHACASQLEREAKLVLVGLNETVTGALKLVGILDLVPTAKTEADALKLK